jgi:transposase InsO family protein
MGPDDRAVRRRLGWFRHVDEVTHNVAKTCRYFGISRQTYYRWYRRYGRLGEAGLRDGSSRPLRSPRATPADVVEKVLYLRRYYHFGPARICMYLRRYHALTISQSGIWRLLKRAGVSRLPSNMRYQSREQRFKRYEKPLPGHQLQIDVKFLAPVAGRTRKYYQYTAIDDCTRVRILKIFDANTQQMAIAFVDYVLSKLPFKVECIQTDNGAEFGPQFHWHVLDKGIQHRYIRPRRPYLNGKTERSHRIDDEEFYRQLDGVVISSVAEFNDLLQEWERFYNYARPHGSLQGQTPYERLREKLQVMCHG